MSKKAPKVLSPSERAKQAQKSRGVAGRKVAALRAHASRARAYAEQAAALWPAEVVQELVVIADQRAKVAEKASGRKAA